MCQIENRGMRIAAMKVTAFDIAPREVCVFWVSSYFQFEETVISPTNIIRFKRNLHLWIDIDPRINLHVSDWKSGHENCRYEGYRIRYRAPRGMRVLSFVLFSVWRNCHISYKYYPIRTQSASMDRYRSEDLFACVRLEIGAWESPLWRLPHSMSRLERYAWNGCGFAYIFAATALILILFFALDTQYRRACIYM